MSYDVVVVGAGLAGMFAGALAARGGARTLVIARGQGGTHLGTGCVDVWGYDGDRQPTADPAASMQAQATANHPIVLAGAEAVEAGLVALQVMSAEAGYSLVGGPDRNHLLPTALGVARPTCLAPESFVAGDLRRPEALALANLAGFRDWHAHLAAANLRAVGHECSVIELDLPRLPARRELFATDLARLMDQSEYRAEVADRWRPRLAGVARLGLPAIVGLTNAHAAWRDLCDRLRPWKYLRSPTLPPSVPGIRLFNVLQAALERAGGRLIIGPSVSGWVEDGTVRDVVANTAGGERRHAARHVILATGGFRHGGLEARSPGVARESVFGLPVETAPEWFAPHYWDPHPYTKFGVQVNQHMQPITPAGAIIYENVFAIGGLLAVADRDADGCREGLDLATAWTVIRQLSVAESIPLPA